MKLQNVPRDSNGNLDIPYLRAQPVFTTIFPGQKEAMIAEVWCSMNSWGNDIVKQVIYSIPYIYR